MHGRGLFAARDIPKGSYVMEYRGEHVGKKEGRRRTDEQWAQGRMYMFTLNRRTDIDGSPEWNLARLANYSCDPNTESENEDGKRIWIKAIKDIPAGAEITYDYNFDFVDPPPPCHCGAANCRGYIVGHEHIAELRDYLKAHGLPVPVGARAKPRKKAAGKPAKRSTKKSGKRSAKGSPARDTPRVSGGPKRSATKRA